MLTTLLELLGVAAIGAGLALATVGVYGLLRMTEVYAQLHAAGLVTGPAVVAVLLGAFATGDVEVTTSAVLIVIFVLITAPLSTHVIARAHYERDRPDTEDAPR